MRLYPLFLIAIVLLVAAPAAAESTAELTVTGYSLDPGLLFSGETGKLTVTVQNTGDSSVNIYAAKLDPPTGVAGFRILNDMTYDSVGTIGPGDSRTFTFTFQANVRDGVYYPKFYLDLDTQGSFRQFIPVEVKSTELVATVSEEPDAFSAGKKAVVVLCIGNPRQNMVNGVTITPSGEGVTFSPKQAFIGALESDTSDEVTFEVTPRTETTLSFLVTYHNGMNDHSTTVTLPVVFGEDKLGAVVVLNNVEIVNSGQYSTVTGDITNAGLTNAYSITATVGNPATPVDPNQVYVIGELEPDDFSSFEVTYLGAGSTIPVVVTYKDKDGNIFTETFDVTQSAGGSSSISVPSSGSSSGPASDTPSGGPGSGRGGMFLFGMGGGSSISIPLMEIGIVLGVVLAVVIIAWRKGYIRKLQERIRRRKPKEDDDDNADR